MLLEMFACICGNQSAEEAHSPPNTEGGACATVVDWLVPREVRMKRGRAMVILIPHIVASSAFSA